MNNESGFTMIELLIVLMIVSTVALFLIPSMYQTVMNQENKHFFKTVASDVFYVQNQTLYTKHQLELSPMRQRYSVISTNQRTSREYPDSIRLMSSPTRIHYSRNGNIKSPSTYLFDNDKKQYRFVLPFGKGRGYLVE